MKEQFLKGAQIVEILLKIIDVIGSIDSNFCNYDQYLNKINDPFPTPFPSSGFDLDAVGVINQGPMDIVLENSTNILENFRIINGKVIFDLKSVQRPVFKAEIFDLTGKIIYQKIYKYNLFRNDESSLKIGRPIKCKKVTNIRPYSIK